MRRKTVNLNRNSRELPPTCTCYWLSGRMTGPGGAPREENWEGAGWIENLESVQARLDLRPSSILKSPHYLCASTIAGPSSWAKQ